MTSIDSSGLRVNGTPATWGAHSFAECTSRGDDSSARGTPPDELALVIDDATLQVGPRTLLDETGVAQLSERLEAADSVRVRYWQVLLRWSEPIQRQTIDLLALAGTRVSVQSCNSPTYSDPLRASLELPVDPSDLTRTSSWLNLAVVCAAVFFRTVADEAARLIRDAQRRHGMASTLPQTLVKRINQLVGHSSTGQNPSATEEAEAYLRNRREQHELRHQNGSASRSDSHVPPLRYYADEVYELTGHRWRTIPLKRFRADVAAFVMSRGVRLGDGFVNAVVLAVQALVCVECWDEPLPFYVIRERPLQVTRPRWLVVSNGVIDIDEAIRSGQLPQLYAYDPKWFSTSALPYAYDPTAQWPLWLSTVRDILAPEQQDDCRIDVLQEFMGYSLAFGDNTYGKALAMRGEGNDGKSVVLDIWEMLVGSDNVSHVPPEKFGDEFRLQGMYGKILNLSAEIAYFDKVNEGVFKQLVTGDAIQVNRKNKDMITKRPTAKIAFACNDLPVFGDKSDGIWRRLLILPFRRQIPEAQVDRTRTSRLAAELPGILNWSLLGMIRLYRQGRFSRCGTCEQELRSHRRDCNPLERFVDEFCVLGTQFHALCEEFYGAFATYCRSRGHKTPSEITVGKQLRRLNIPGFDRVRDGVTQLPSTIRRWRYHGIGLVEDGRRELLRLHEQR